MIKKKFGLAGLALALSLPLANTAQADGFYVGAGLYQSSIDFDGLNDEDAVPAAFVGYNFWDTVAKISAEVGYYDLGSYKESILGSTVGVDASAISAMGVAGVGLGPMIEVYAKAGLAVVSADVESAVGKASDNEMEPVYGLGASIDILDIIDIYAEYLRVDSDFETDLVGVGVRLDF